MATVMNKAAARSYFEEVLNRGSMSTADTIFAPDIHFHYPLGELSGAEGVKDYLATFRRAFPGVAAKKVLALGCGTGVEVRELVRSPGFGGTITAIDISANLVEKGRDLAKREGFADRIEWQVGDAQELALPDGAFDLVLAHTLVSHVPDPGRVVQQAARVVRPGGTVVIFDGDYATITFGTDREMDEKIMTGVIANPRVMRSMPRLLRDVGLRVIDSRSWVLSEIGRADFFLSALQSFPVLLPRAGVTTSEEIGAFVAEQVQSCDDGTFFGACNFHAMIAARPL